MGRYATTTSISELVPQFLSGNTTSADAAGSAIFSRHIDRAEGKINAALSALYEVSAFTTTAIPPLLRTLAEDIASYYTLRGVYVQDGQAKQTYVDDYKSALETLKLVAGGDMSLSYTDGSEVPTKSDARFLSNTENYDHVFGMDEATAWAVDETQLDDLGDTRS